jgi:hypothetical protein
LFLSLSLEDGGIKQNRELAYVTYTSIFLDIKSLSRRK